MKAFFPSACISLLVAAAALPASAQTQTLPPGRESLDGDSSTNGPFTTTATGSSSHIWQWVYDASLFAHAGPMTITDIRVRANVGTALAAFDIPSFEVIAATAAPGQGVGAMSTTFSNNLGGDATILRAAAQWVGGPVAGNPSGPSPFFSLGLGASFDYNPCLGDLVIQVRKCGSTVQWNQNLDAETGETATLHRIGNTSACTNLTSNSTGAGFAPVLEIAYTPTGPSSEPFERNSAAASLKLDHQDGTGFGPIDVRECTGGFVRICLESTLSAMAWDLGVTSAPAVSAPTCLGAGTGGLRTPNDQLINLALNAPDLVWLNGLGFLAAWPGPKLTIPMQSFSPIPNLTGQAVWLDPAHPDGVQLSCAGQVHYDAQLPLGGPVVGPATDDSATTMSVGCVPFHGIAYTQIHPSSNGRVMFVAQDTNAAPDTVGEILFDNPFFGCWMDLNPANGGTITVDSPTSTSFRVQYTGVPYFGEAPALANTFAVEIDGATGEILLSGLDGILNHPAAAPNSGDSAYFGISAGVTRVVDNGPTAFALGGPNDPTGPLDAIYSHGLAGPGLAGAGVTALRFIPILSGPNEGSYTWTGL